MEGTDPVIGGPLGREPVRYENPTPAMVESPAETNPNVTPPQRVAREKLKLGRKRRVIQNMIELFIRGFAFLSFAVIILIFIFVFKEAAPMFWGTPKVDTNTTTADSANKSFTSSQATTTADSVAAAENLSAPSPKAKFQEATKTETKTDANGKKIKVSKEGGNVEQEVFDPLADEPAATTTPTTPKKETPKSVTPKKPSKPTSSDTSNHSVKSGKKLAVADTAKANAASSSQSNTPAKPKDDLTYTKTTNGGAVAQEEFDPFANETGIATLKGPPQKKPEMASNGAAVVVDSAALKAAKAEADTARAREIREVEERKHVTDLPHLLGTIWQPVSTLPKFGLLALLVGTLKVTLLSILFGAPVAISAALYTSTFASKWLREIIKPAIELLAGFPSVVIGFFALIVMATVFQDFFHYQFRLNSLLGGVAMSFAVIPIIYTITEDALTAVPNTLREASDALGATKWQTAFSVVLPAAIPGVFAAVVLGFGRAFGETMIALMATGNAPLTSWNILEPVRTFAATIGAEMAEVVFGDQHYNVLFFIGSLLFVFTFTMNAVVEFWVRKRLLRRIQGK